jgi:very-short-patch-repair endonuclease
MDPAKCSDEIAARHHGAISRSQALACGLTDNQIRGRLARGDWIALDSSVFVARSAPRTWERQMHAALLSRPVALTANRSAGYLHGFPGFRKGRPEILVPFLGNARSPLAKVMRSRHFDRIESTTVSGFSCTSIAETILTLSFRESRAVIERVVDDQIAAGRLHVTDFDPIFERLEGVRMRGLPMLGRVIGERDTDAYQPPTTELERLLYELLDADELPEYSRQLPIDYQRARATVDAYVSEWRLIVEGDGRRWHTRKADFEKDRRRDNAAAAAGFLVVRFTYQMLRDEPSACLDTLLDTGRWRSSA